jgi:alpha-tubulin suppressor-like RCC1 family protein
MVACGGEFSMIVTASGTLYSFGLPEYGQLGKDLRLVFAESLFAESLFFFAFPDNQIQVLVRSTFCGT